MTPQEIADEIDRDIAAADRDAQLAAHAFSLDRFPAYWGAYLGKQAAEMEKAYGELSGPAAAGGDG